MTSFPKALTRLPSTFIHMAGIPACFLAAAMLYEPKALTELLRAGADYTSMSGIHSFNTVICSAIIFLVLAALRITLWLIRKRFPADLWSYAFWCTGEILICCAFCGLYLGLMDHNDAGGYFHYFGAGISSIGSVLVNPYVVLTLLYLALDDSKAIPPESDIRLKFYDNRHQLKFITTASSITYIESNENYILVHYLENGIPKKFQIRTSMKNIEPLCERAGFARAHRCYIVNPLHVKQIRKGPNGTTFADLGDGTEEGIPVSKKYYENITSLL